MHGIMPALAQPFDDSPGDAGIGEKSHLAALRRVDLLLSEPGRILERLFDVGRLEVRIILEHLFRLRAVGDLSDDDRYRYAHAADARSAPHDLWVERDSVEFHRLLRIGP